jgi:hypothetical protein
MSKAFIQKISLPFNPTRIAGCQLWLDGADAATVTGTSSVTAWTDKSGKGNNPTFSGTNPSYSSATKVITTANANQQFTVPAASIQQSTGSGSLFFVYGDQQTGGGNSSGYNALWGTATPSERFYQTLQAPTNAYAINGPFSPSGTVSTALATTNTLLYNMNYTYNSSTGDLRINGTTLSSSYGGTPVPSGALTLSGTGWGVVANVRLYEVISYKGATLLTTPQIQQIEGYLAQKWGLTANLPPGHPGLTQTIYTSNYNANNPGSAITPSPAMTNTPYPTISPINLGGTGACQLWLDAADLSSLTVTGTTVTRWNDKSGNGYYASSNTGTVTSTTNLINGKNSIFFPAFSALSIKNSGGTISFSVGSAITIFVVAQGVGNITTQNSGYFFFSNGSFLGYGTGNIAPANLSVTFYHISSYYMASVQNSVEVDYTVTTSTYNTPNIFAYNPQIGTATFNGTVYSAATQTLPSGSYDQYIGGPRGDSYAYQLGEIIIYNTSLATPQRQQVEGYLAWKWGLQTNLPPTHPYYNGPPGRPSQVAGIPLVNQMTHPTVPGYYPFYQVDSNTWTTGWLPYLQQLVAANANATANTTLGTITGTSVGFYVASFLAPNGLIYLMDNQNNPMGVITPTATGGIYSSTTVTGVGPPTQYGDNYKGGGLASNGIIYLVNFESIGIGTINTNTNVYTNNPYNANPGAAAVTGGVLAPDGNIYCSPYVDTSHIYYFTPGANTLSSFSISASIRYCKPFLAPNGKIYCLGIGTKVVGVIDPVAKTFTEVGTCANQQYCFMVLGGNGVVYAFPLNATGIGTLDLTTNIVTANVISGGTGYYGGILGPDGNIYLYQSSAGNIGVLNTKTNTLSVLTTTTNGYLSAVLAANGNIYLGAANVIVFSGVTQTPTLNFCLTPNLNNGADRF